MNSTNEDEGMWWCNTHQREATYIDKRGEHCCHPRKGGIAFPCSVVFAQMEIVAINLDNDKDIKKE